MIAKFRSSLLFLMLSLFVMAQSALAVISPTDETALLAGVSASDALFYKIGGGILIVLAGIWGFKQVRKLL